MNLTIHERIALDITEAGCGLIRCEKCGDNHQPGTSEIADYLANGWPKHCGESMHWWTKAQLDAGRVVTFPAGVSS